MKRRKLNKREQNSGSPKNIPSSSNPMEENLPRKSPRGKTSVHSVDSDLQEKILKLGVEKSNILNVVKLILNDDGLRKVGKKIIQKDKTKQKGKKLNKKIESDSKKKTILDLPFDDDEEEDDDYLPQNSSQEHSSCTSKVEGAGFEDQLLIDEFFPEDQSFDSDIVAQRTRSKAPLATLDADKLCLHDDEEYEEWLAEIKLDPSLEVPKNRKYFKYKTDKDPDDPLKDPDYDTMNDLQTLKNQAISDSELNGLLDDLMLDMNEIRMNEIRMNEKGESPTEEDKNEKSSDENKKEAADEKESEERSVDQNEDDDQVDKSPYKLSPDDLLIDRDCVLGKLLVNDGKGKVVRRLLMSQQIIPEGIVSKRPTLKSTIKSFAFTRTQQDMLVIQMLQHIQLLTQTNLLCRNHEYLKEEEEMSSVYLKELKMLGDTNMCEKNDDCVSFFHPPGLDEAISITEMEIPEVNQSTNDIYSLTKDKKHPIVNQPIPDNIGRIMARSSIFQFSSLLPHYAPGPKKLSKAALMTKNEDALLIFGLHQLRNSAWPKYALISKYLMPARCPKKLMRRVYYCCNISPDEENSIYQFHHFNILPQLPTLSQSDITLNPNLSFKDDVTFMKRRSVPNWLAKIQSHVRVDKIRRAPVRQHANANTTIVARVDETRQKLLNNPNEDVLVKALTICEVPSDDSNLKISSHSKLYQHFDIPLSRRRRRYKKIVQCNPHLHEDQVGKADFVQTYQNVLKMMEDEIELVPYNWNSTEKCIKTFSTSFIGRIDYLFTSRNLHKKLNQIYQLMTNYNQEAHSLNDLFWDLISLTDCFPELALGLSPFLLTKFPYRLENSDEESVLNQIRSYFKFMRASEFSLFDKNKYLKSTVFFDRLLNEPFLAEVDNYYCEKLYSSLNISRLVSLSPYGFYSFLFVGSTNRLLRPWTRKLPLQKSTSIFKQDCQTSISSPDSQTKEDQSSDKKEEQLETETENGLI